MTVFEKIQARQKGKEDTTVYMVGQQLKDICRDDPACAELVDKDLDNPDMSIENCEEKIRAYADQLKARIKAKCVGVSPEAAERIIREFYGLPGRTAEPETGVVTVVPTPATGGLNMADFF